MGLAIARGADGGELAKARPFLMLVHHDRRMRVDHAHNRIGGKEGAGQLRIVLKADRYVGAECADDAGHVAFNRLVGSSGPARAGS